MFNNLKEIEPKLKECFNELRDFMYTYLKDFGKEVGAAAVQLLIDNIHGVTVSHITGNGEIRYMVTKDAIVQRHVDLGVLALHENLGVCFGRKPQPSSPKSAKIDSLPDRIY